MAGIVQRLLILLQVSGVLNLLFLVWALSYVLCNVKGIGEFAEFVLSRNGKFIYPRLTPDRVLSCTFWALIIYCVYIVLREFLSPWLVKHLGMLEELGPKASRVWKCVKAVSRGLFAFLVLIGFFVSFRVTLIPYDAGYPLQSYSLC